VQPTSSSPNRTNPWKRYGPIVAIAAVVAIVAVVAVLASSSDDDDGETTAGTGTTVATGELPEGVMNWTTAEAQGLTDEIDWGERCDTTRGQVAYPSFFAPECYAPFTGDNGGATAQGVTADSIKVVLYLTPETDPVIDFITSAIATDDTNAQDEATMRGFVEFYETFFETYGRNVDLVVYEGTGGSNDEVAARADAVAIAEMQPFAVLGGPLLTPAFADELAARRVLCIQCTPGQNADWYVERDPYVWGVTNNPEQGQSHVAEYITKRLGDQNAQWAGDALQSQPRKFGLIYLSTSDATERLVDQFEANLAEGGVVLAEKLSYASPIDLQTTSPQLIARLKDSGVTSVIFNGDPVAPQPLTIAATSQDYQPEWIITGSVLTDTTAFARTYDQDQWSRAFGVSTLAARVNPEVSSTYFLYEWFFGEPPPTTTGSPTLVPMLNLFYAVLQGTGPNLTHENWRNALFNGSPTPTAVSQPSLSYGEKGIWPFPDFLGIDDATEIWWDPTTTGLDELRREGPGMYRYVDGGLRYLPGSWPETAPRVFDPEGSVTIYEEAPPGEGVPDYPPRR
jgi:hypothetical protein